MFNIFNKKRIINNLNINDSAYGGFLISKNITRNGKKIRFTYREQSNVKELNGWNIYSIIDDEEYIKDPNNFEIASATTIYKIAPIMLELFDAPYGTDLKWIYKENVHIGFFDLKNNKEISIDEILKK